MSRFSKKVDHFDNIDRVNGLPSDLTNNILERLPITDLIRTSILSRKWRCMWASVPRVKFEDDFFQQCKRLKYPRSSSIITEVLLLHSGPIQEFTLHIPYYHQIKMECLNKWILFLSGKSIKKLQLLNLQLDPYKISSCLFQCQELTYLELRNFKLSIPSNFHGFKSLLDLHLTYITFDSATALESLMFGCPLLMELTISYCSGSEHINISTPTLKDLYIEGHDVPKSICLNKAQNLIDLTLLADRLGANYEKDKVSDLIKGLHKIERLLLDTSYIKVLSEGINQQVLNSLTALKYLELNRVNFYEAGEVLSVISLMKISPNLQEIVIKSNNMDMGPEQILEEFDYTTCCFNQLQTVNIIVKTAYKYALNLIQIVLANSSSLEILTFKVGLGQNQSDAPILSSISSALFQMKRASPRAKVELLHNGRIE